MDGDAAIREAGFWPVRPGELMRFREAERSGVPFLVYRDGDGDQRLHRLDDTLEQVLIGRRSGSALVLDWDEQVSRAHAQLERVGEEWVLVDDGLSRNGTFVNGERVHGRRRLRDGDVVVVGRTSLLFRGPLPGAAHTTVAPDQAGPITLSDGQRKVLLALCRPYAREPGLAPPATNEQIAAELFLTVSAVKAHLRGLFHKFGIDELPQVQKRTRLARMALESGLVTVKDLG